MSEDSGSSELTYSLAVPNYEEYDAIYVSPNYTISKDANGYVCYHTKMVMDLVHAGNICAINHLVLLPYDVNCFFSKDAAFTNTGLVAKRTREYASGAYKSYLEFGASFRWSSIEQTGLIIAEIYCTNERCFVEVSYKEMQ